MPSQATIEAILSFAGRFKQIDLELLRETLELGSLHHKVDRVVEEELAGWGMTARQIEILEVLYHRPTEALTPAHLSDEVGLTRSAMTSALDGLEKLGHTARTPHPTDRRMIVISLTPSGRQFIGQSLSQHYQNVTRIVGCLTPQERATMLCVYAKILNAFDAAPRREEH